MKPATGELPRSLARLAESNDFDTFMAWVTESFHERINLLLVADRNNAQVEQGYSRALSDIINTVNKSRETLDRLNKNTRDTR